MEPTDFDLVLVDPNSELCDAFQLHFKDHSRVSVSNGFFQQLDEFDCMVSAANSFGLMDGGVDAAITAFFGFELMDAVQSHIVNEYRGEQPVGTSFIIETGHKKHRYLAHTPTMRVPMPITATDNVYLAMWAMLVAVWKHNCRSGDKIQTVACPGLGTATGRVSADSAANQMALAYSNFLNPPSSISWPYAADRQAAIGRGGDQGFMKIVNEHFQ